MSIVPIWIKKTAYYAMQAINFLAISVWFFAFTRLIINVLLDNFSEGKFFSQFYSPMLMGIMGAAVFFWLHKARDFFGVK